MTELTNFDESGIDMNSMPEKEKQGIMTNVESLLSTFQKK